MIPDPTAVTLIERLRQRSPGALELATYASVAVYIEPELLRALRLGIAPHLEVGVEADLWSSRIVEARSHEGMTLRTAVAHQLRNSLRDETDRRVARRAWEIVRTVHADTSPAIAQEEALAWFAIDGNQFEIELALKRALRSMAEERERGLANWWLRARERLPDECRGSPTARSLDRRAMLELGMEASLGAEAEEDAFQRMLDNAGDSLVFARRGHSALEVGDFEPDSSTVALRVPDLTPLRLEVIWEPEGHPLPVTLRPGRSEIVTVTGPTTEVITERGDVYAIEHSPRPASEAELLLLGRILQAALLGCVAVLRGSQRDGLLEEAAPIIDRIVGEFVDPPWRRAQRVLADRLELSKPPRFSKFAAACVDRVAREAEPPLESVLKKTAVGLQARLEPYDQIETTPADRSSITHEGNLALVVETAEIFEAILSPGDPLLGWKDWVWAQLNPTWLSLALDEQPPSPDGLFDLITKRLPPKGPEKRGKASVLSAPLEDEPLKYLLRQRPDLDLTPLPHRDGYQLQGSWHDVRWMAGWASQELSRGIRALLERRSAPEPDLTGAGTVAADGSGEFRSIGAAVESLGEHATIHVAAGVYHESVRLRPGQKLLGPDEGEAVVDAGGKGWVLRTADGCEIRGLTVRGGGGETGVNDCGIMIDGSSEVVIAGNRIVENGHYGVIVRECDALIEHNLIAGNAIVGIYVGPNVHAEIRFNRIAAHKQAALDITDRIRGVFTNNTVYDCNLGVIVQFEPHGRPMELDLVGNIFMGNRVAIEAPRNALGPVEHNLFHRNRKDYWDWSASRAIRLPATNLSGDPRFLDAERNDFRIAHDSAARGAGPERSDIGALVFQPDAEDTIDRSAIGILLWHEGVGQELPQSAEEHLRELGYGHVKREQWAFAKERGDPSLTSLGGNSIHYHRDAQRGAERLRMDLADILALKLIGHGDSEEMFAGSIWGFEPEQMYVFIAWRPARWEVGLIQVTDYGGVMPEPSGDGAFTSRLRRRVDLTVGLSGHCSLQRLQDSIMGLMHRAKKRSESDSERPTGLLLGLTGYVYTEGPRSYLLLSSDDPNRPYTPMDIEEFVASLRQTFDHVVVAVDGYQATADLDSLSWRAETLLDRKLKTDRDGDSLLLVSRLGTRGRLIKTVFDKAAGGIDSYQLVSDIEARGKGWAEREDRMDMRVQSYTHGRNFQIDLAPSPTKP